MTSTEKPSDYDLRATYRRDDLKDGVRGKYVDRYRQGTNLATLAPQVASVTTDSLLLPDGTYLAFDEVLRVVGEYKRRAVFDLYDRTSEEPHDDVTAVDLLSINALNAFGARTPPMTPMANLWAKRDEVAVAVRP